MSLTSSVGQLVKNSPVMQETPGSIPGLGRSPREGIGYPLQYSWASLDDKESVCNAGRPGLDLWGWEDSLEEGMATHSIILTWRIPWTKEPGRL